MTTELKREGPRVIVTKRRVECEGCRWHASEYYCIEDGNDCDSGFDYFCLHGDKRRFVDGRETPDWCPFKADALERAPVEPAGVTDEMVERAIEAHFELFDSGDAVGAMRAALTAALTRKDG